MLKQTNLVRPNIHGAHQKGLKGLAVNRSRQREGRWSSCTPGLERMGHPLPVTGHWRFMWVTGSDYNLGPGGEGSGTVGTGTAAQGSQSPQGARSSLSFS